MIWTIFAFEFHRQFRHPATGVICLVFFSLAAYAGSHNDWLQAHPVSTMINAPANVGLLLGLVSIAALYLCGPLLAIAIVRDTTMPLASLLLSLPFSNFAYVVGKMLAGITLFLMPVLAVAAGLHIGVLMPWVDASTLAPITAQPYLFGIFWLALPNAFFAAAFIITFATLTRSTGSTYFGLIVLFLLYALSLLALHASARELAELLDPFGTRAFVAFNVHTGVNDSAAAINADRMLILNRALWIGVSSLLLALPITLLRRTTSEGSSKQKNTIAHVPASSRDKRVVQQIIPVTRQGIVAFRQGVAVAGFSFFRVVRCWPFWLVALGGIILLSGDTATIDALPEAHFLPVQHVFLEALTGQFQTLLVLALVFFAAEMVFAERNHRVADITGAMPVSERVWLAGKVVAVIGVALAFELIGVATCALWQWIRLPEAFDAIAFFQSGLIGIGFPLLMGLAAFALMLLAKDQRSGFLLVALLLLSKKLAETVGGNARLLDFGSLPTLAHSDLIGYGGAFTTWLEYFLYWLIVVAGVLLMVCGLGRHSFSARRDVALRLRWLPAVTPVIALIAAAALASQLPKPWRNTQLLNSGLTEAQAARYELAYRRFAGEAQPTITAINATVDLFPQAHRVAAHERLRLANRTAQPITKLYLDWNPGVSQKLLTPVVSIDDDRELGFAITSLATPIKPGEEREIEFATQFDQPRGEPRPDIGLIEPGATLILGSEFFPHLGYDPVKEIIDEKSREKHNLAKSTLDTEIDSSQQYATSLFRGHFGRVNLDLAISTPADETPFAPGRLVDSREENGRRSAHYVSDRPLSPYLAIASGKWAVDRRTASGINIEVYHHPGHAYNIENILVAAQAALAYYSKAFGAYALPTFSIIEVPRQYPNPQSFPGFMVMPEQIGFLFDLQSTQKMDWLQMVIAHEVAHQWWGQREIPAFAKGADVLTETLAQYSATRVIRQVDGKTQMQAFVDEARQNYLSARKSRSSVEPPLKQSFREPGLAYEKGLVVFDHLAHVLGEHRVNQVLAIFFSRYNINDTVYPLAQDLQNALREQASDAERLAIDDAFDSTGELIAEPAATINR